MAGKVSNPRDLFVLLLGELLYVERRLAGAVLGELERAVADAELVAALRAHLEQTREHVNRVERVFLKLEVAPSAHLSTAFESAVSQHHQLAGSIVTATLADVFHAQAALHTEHWEIAAYTALLELGRRIGYKRELAEFEDSLEDERSASGTLLEAIGRIAKTVGEV
jgi:ferritin-like metal-binding protein YciE